ncbi:MAG: tRNA-dihydrouridine synthase family protein [Muribaculaceae bacterium]|nr:tRNA-dihydrouridine synthase family protein [Muribaculaceae bacterium]
MNTDCLKISAPLQGYTDHIWRNAHSQCFGGVDVYCAPFMRIDHGAIRNRDINDISPSNNAVAVIRPQLLASAPQEAVSLATTIRGLGYNVIDINLGCPHPPVAHRHKGAGLLKYPDELAKMLEALTTVEGVSYTAKMRLGWDANDQWVRALDVLAAIKPLHVAIHPRVGTQQYKGDLDMEQAARFIEACPFPVMFSGNVETVDDFNALIQQFPMLKGIMIGRGLVARPYAFAPETKSNLPQFHDMLVQCYSERLNGGEAQLVTKLKNLWEIFLPEADRKARKAIKKSHNLSQYTTAAHDAINSVVND